jgi:hypothetical protein
VILCFLILGTALGGAEWLNPERAKEEARRMSVETTYQQQLYEIQLKATRERYKKELEWGEQTHQASMFALTIVAIGLAVGLVGAGIGAGVGLSRRIAASSEAQGEFALVSPTRFAQSLESGNGHSKSDGMEVVMRRSFIQHYSGQRK